MIQKMINKFNEFLRMNGAENKFKTNLKNAWTNPDSYMKAGLAHDVILGAFDWESTPEGEDYWWDLHYKWERFMNL